MDDSTELSQVLIMGAVLFFIAVSGYIGYRLFKKYAQDGFQNCRRRTAPDVPDAGRNEGLTTLIASKEPKLILDQPQEKKVGESYQFRIQFENKRRTLRALADYPGGTGSGDRPPSSTSGYGGVSTLLRRSHPFTNIQELLSQKTKIEVVKVIGFPENVSIVREYEVDPITMNDILLVTFTVRESGYYDVRVQYNGRPIPESPFLISFLPTKLDCDKTGLVRQSPTVLFSTASVHSMMIEPRDKFGNLCQLDDIELDKFAFEVKHVEETMKDESVGAYTFNFLPCSIDDWGQLKTMIRFESEIFAPGIFKGLITYDGKQIGSGSFDIITLSSEEHYLLKEMLKRATTGTVYHEAQLKSMNNELFKKQKTVYIYISPKLVTVKEFYLGFIPSRLSTYRVLPATKVQLLFTNSGQSTFTIYDRIQPNLKLEMDTTSFRLSLALYAHFLQEKLGGSESFENKQKFFYEELRNAREDKNRLFIGLRIDRKNLVESSFYATKHFGVRDWCKKFKVQFIGEEGSDDGGLRREWMNLLCCKLFENNPEGLFCAMGNSRLVHPNPDRAATWDVKYYELAGKVVAKCLFETALGGHNKQMVNGRFTRSFLGQIIGYSPQFKYFEQDDPELYLGKVKYLRETDLDDNPMDIAFTEEVYKRGSVQVMELISGGTNIRVTNGNKEEYLNALAQYRLGTRVQKEIEAFNKSLNEIIPDGLLTNFDENELEILMCGKSTFQVQDLKLFHVVSDTDDHLRNEVNKILSWFWTTVENLTDEERGRLLQFTTGSSLLPHGGFKELQPTFRITITHSYGKLPISHTCFNEICLSKHKSFEGFQKSLRTAINEGSEGFGFM